MNEIRPTSPFSDAEIATTLDFLGFPNLLAFNKTIRASNANVIRIIRNGHETREYPDPRIQACAGYLYSRAIIVGVNPADFFGN